MESFLSQFTTMKVRVNIRLRFTELLQKCPALVAPIEHLVRRGVNIFNFLEFSASLLYRTPGKDMCKDLVRSVLSFKNKVELESGRAETVN